MRTIGWFNIFSYILAGMHIPIYYYIISILVFTVLIWKTKKRALSILVAYVFLILASTVLVRNTVEKQMIEISPLWYFRNGEVSRDILNQIEANIVMFIPLGLLIAVCLNKPNASILIASFISCCIELLQLILHRGLCEVSDVISNTIGATIGLGLFLLIRWVKTKYNHQ